MIRAVLFDLDGVLIDSFNSWFKAVNLTLKKFGKPALTEEEFRKGYWGYDIRTCLKKLKLGEEAVRYCNSVHLQFLDEIKLMPGAKEAVEWAASRFRTALVTNSPKTEVEEVCRKFGLKFDFVLTGNDIRNGKPDPEMILEVCKKLEIEPKEAVLIGDTASDLEAGKKAGCMVIGLGFQADFKLDSISQLPSLLSYIQQKNI
ncbi:MAG: hypothetical protein DRP12_00960 [Candidatus Aenigmatarchaeota archaeon]|nr:MAG: hypothetical protein DRP12_00960 [Candidatus Aenigmarchaeota archaeon]